jgi:hypothetical protein
MIGLVFYMLLQLPMGNSAPSPATGNTYTVIQHKVNDSIVAGSTISVTVTSTTIGNLLVVGVAHINNAVTVASVSDNASGGSNTYVQAAGAAAVISTGGNPAATDLWYVLNATNGGATTVTVTLSASDAYRAIWVWEAHPTTTVVFDAAAHADNQTGSGTDNAGASVTTTAKGFIVSLDAPLNSVVANPKAGNNFTSGGDIAANGPAGASLISTASGTYQAVWTDSASGDKYCSSTAAFK